MLDEEELEPGVSNVELKTEGGDDLIASNEQILASVAVSRGRVYLVSTKHIYCIGQKNARACFAASDCDDGECACGRNCSRMSKSCPLI